VPVVHILLLYKSAETVPPYIRAGFKLLANVTFSKRRRRRIILHRLLVLGDPPTLPPQNPAPGRAALRYGSGRRGSFACGIYTYGRLSVPVRWTDTQLITAAAPTGPCAVRRRSYFTGQLPVDRVKRRKRVRICSIYTSAWFTCTPTPVFSFIITNASEFSSYRYR